MNQNTERSAVWKALKGAGWQPEEGRRFVQYSRDQLVHELEQFQNATGQIIEVVVEEDLPEPEAQEPTSEEVVLDPEAAAFFGLHTDTPAAPAAPEPAPEPAPAPPLRLSNQPAEGTLPGAHTLSLMEPIRRDDQGRVWFQEEVLKPAYPKPRGRRILRYMDEGVKTETVVAGEYVESYEVAGDRAPRAAEVKITLPSYQVGIYLDPRFPQFKIHTYNGSEGFNLDDVELFYGGPELVPAGVKRIYVENDLCYDIRSVVRAIQDEHRSLQLQGRNTP